MLKYVTFCLFVLASGLYAQSEIPVHYGGVTEMAGIILSGETTFKPGAYRVSATFGDITIFDQVEVMDGDEYDIWAPGLGFSVYTKYLKATKQYPLPSGETLSVGPFEVDSVLSQAVWKISNFESLTLREVCEVLGIPSDYRSRYERIVFPLDEVGIYLFDPKTNPYFRFTGIPNDRKSELAYVYIGNPEQNSILKRNIIKNRSLFDKGSIRKESRKEWVVVR